MSYEIARRLWTAFRTSPLVGTDFKSQIVPGPGKFIETENGFNLMTEDNKNLVTEN